MEKIICSKCGIEYQWSEYLNDMACPNCWRRSIIYSVEWQMKRLPNNRVHSDAGDSAASTSLSNASAESTSQAETKPAQRG